LAALGATIAFIMEIELDTPESLVISVLFVLVGGAFFAWTRSFTHRVPQEAVIGIVYIVAASAALLLSSFSVHGDEHLKTMLSGSILWTTWEDVIRQLAVSVIVAVLLGIYHKKIEEQSFSYRSLSTTEIPSFWKWDFLFYVLLGMVIVFFIKTAGIFTIFTFLIIPATCAALFVDQLFKQFVVGSILAISVSLIGLTLSFYLDLPTGATLVCSFGVAFFIALILSKFKFSGQA
ncbi:MAG: metal ABC transporter permease, partial [Nitrospina sp.]|nr:metal ABC transporter permease [Nitrospina sp.]